MPTLIDDRKYPSTRRGSTATYECKKWEDGSYSCNCPGWRFKQPDKPRGCSHCEWFRNDYWLVTIAEAARISLTNVKYDVITTYGRFLYLLRFRAGEMFRPVAPKPVPAVTVLRPDPPSAGVVPGELPVRTFNDILRKAQERADRTRQADLNAAAVAEAVREADRRAKALGVKPWTKPAARPNTQPARARREFDEEV